MMKLIFLRVWPFTFLLGLASCGGSGSSGDPHSNSSTAPTLSSLSVSSLNIGSSLSSLAFSSVGNKSSLSLQNNGISSSAISYSSSILDSLSSSSVGIMPSIVFGAIQEASYRRVDFIFIGDSNAALGGHGWDHGFQYALSKQYGIYATGAITPRENNGNGSGLGYFYNFAWYSPSLTFTDTPASLHKYMDGSISPQMYAYVDQANVSASMGMMIANGGAINVDNSIRFHFCYGTFASGGGSTDFGVRLEEPPYTTLATGVIDANTGTDSVGFTYLDIPAASRDMSLGARFLRHGGEITAPFMAYYTRAEDPSVDAGISLTTWHAVGGKSLYDMAKSFLTANDETIWLQLNEARRLQESKGQEPIVVMVVSSGVNDLNETIFPSLGPNPGNVPNSADAYVDNLAAFIDRVEVVWNAKFSSGKIYWLIVPSHPVSVPDDEKLLNYRAATKNYVSTKTNVAMIDLDDLIGGQPFIDNSFYLANGTDTAHLTKTAYEFISTEIVKSITSYP